MRGSWDDFTSKWGFHDGESSEERDYVARVIIVRELNRLMPPSIRAVEFDRPGMHNSCLILLFKVKSRRNPPQSKLTKLVEKVYTSNGTEAEKVKLVVAGLLPDIIDIEQIVGNAYDEAFTKSIEEAGGSMPEKIQFKIENHKLTPTAVIPAKGKRYKRQTKSSRA